MLLLLLLICTVCTVSAVCTVCTVCTDRTVCTVCTICTIYTMCTQYARYVRMYLVPSMHPYASVCIRMHSYVIICIRHASVCTHMTPYALFAASNANIQHTFSQESQKVKTGEHRKIMLGIGSIKLLRIQPKTKNLVKPRTTKKNDFEICVVIGFVVSFALRLSGLGGRPPAEGPAGRAARITLGHRRRRRRGARGGEGGGEGERERG